jgi:hypothetical protein
MMNPGMWDALRIFNVIASIVVVALLFMGAIARWDEMPLRFKRITPWVIGTYVVIAYGSGEAFANDVEPGYRIVLLSANLLGLIVSLVYRMGDRTYEKGRLRDDVPSIFRRHGPVQR